jgi:hypothetical protein
MAEWAVICTVACTQGAHGIQPIAVSMFAVTAGKLALSHDGILADRVGRR